MDLYFSDRFEVDPKILERYGAFNICVASDLPMFIDPFLLFNSKKPEYQALHNEIIQYIVFLRDRAANDADRGVIANLYQFPEVKQNWLGYCYLSNAGRGPGPKFGRSLYSNLNAVLSNFGNETVTRSPHLEKLILLEPGVGKDSVSDMITNVVKHFFLDYTQRFAQDHIDPKYLTEHRVNGVRFNRETETLETETYTLPTANGDFVLLTPMDLLTKDDSWINYQNMIGSFQQVAASVTNEQLRSSLNSYFLKRLAHDAKKKRKEPTKEQRHKAIADTIREHPEFIDWYIKYKEDKGEEASIRATKLVERVQDALVVGVTEVIKDLATKTTFFAQPFDSLEESLVRVNAFKSYIENNDGYRLLDETRTETDAQLFFGLIWHSSIFDVNREVNNGRGPVDFKISFGDVDKSLIEFKMASNTALKRNLENQVAVYEAANNTTKSIKVIIVRKRSEAVKTSKILKELKLEENPHVVVIDARHDNKPSASKA